MNPRPPDLSRLDALLLAEALRLRADAGRSEAQDDHPDTLADAAKAASPEARLLRWATMQPGRHRLLDDHRAARHWLARLYGLALLLIALAAAGSLGLLLGGSTPINASALLAALLVWPGAMLLLWLLLRIVPSERGDGGWLQALIARLLRRLSPGSAALLALLARGPFGLWARSGFLHLAWASAFAGTLAALLFRLLFRQYDFVWQTTLLSPATLDAVLHALGAGPALFGITVPTPDLPAEAGRPVWGRFVIACVAVYGLLPRLLAAALSALLARQALGRTMLDLSQPFWVERLLAISRAAQATTPQGAPAPAVLTMPGAAGTADPRPIGRHVAVLRLEPETDDAPRAVSDHWHAVDLGSIAGREALKRGCADLANLAARPARLLVTCSLARTPDRGAVSSLQALAAAAGAPLAVLLVDRALLPARGADAAGREADWRRHAAEAGAQQVRVGELDALLARPLPDLRE